MNWPLFFKLFKGPFPFKKFYFKPANFEELQHLILMSVDKIPSNIDNLDGMFPRKSRQELFQS